MRGLHSDYASFIVRGMSDQAKVLGYDLYVYTYFGLCAMGGKRLHGESNIINLINPSDYDAFIVYKTLIHEEYIRNVIDRICQKSGKPWIELEQPEDSDTPYFMNSDREKFRQVTEHMLTAHNYRKIYCITGPKGFWQSEERLQGYLDAMRAHGIEPPSEWQFYGDFWKDYARNFADRLAAGEILMPQAVVCASTSSALTLIERLREHHIHVPEQLAVAGYDYSFAGEMFNPTITSISFPHYNNGVKAVCRIHKLMTGEIISHVPYLQESLRIGNSCGCMVTHDSMACYFKGNVLEKEYYRDLFRNSGMQEALTKAENTHDFFHRLAGFHYMVCGRQTMHYFLCDDWDGIHNVHGDDYRKDGYSESLHVYSQNGLEVCRYRTASIEDVQNLAAEYATQPSTFFFFPMHYEDRVFGFVGMHFCETRFTPDEQFWNFLEILNNSLEMLRIRLYTTRFSERIQLAVIRDHLTGTYNSRGFEELSAEIFDQAVIHRERFLLILIRIFNLSDIQHAMGYQATDQLQIRTAEILSTACKGNEICCHTRPDTFYIVGSHLNRQGTKLADEKNVTEYFSKHFLELEKLYGARLDMELYHAHPEEASLSQIIQQLVQSLHKKNANRYKELQHTGNLEDLRRMIHAHPEQKWTIDSLAKRMMLSRAYFQRMYKKKFGVSVSADIIASRIEKAKRLLLSGCSIYETAEQCGYSTDVYFMHQFKKETGMTPTEFQNHEKYNAKPQ